jgi:hypothetical protein
LPVNGGSNLEINGKPYLFIVRDRADRRYDLVECRFRPKTLPEPKWIHH